MAVQYQGRYLDGRLGCFLVGWFGQHSMSLGEVIDLVGELMQLRR